MNEKAISEKLKNAADKDLFAAAKESLAKGLEEKVNKLLQEGRRAMIGNDYQGSLKPLAECCHLISENFGELDERLADPAYYYGSSLLEVVRASQNVFGDGVEDQVNDENKENSTENKCQSSGDKQEPDVDRKEENNEDEDGEEEEEDDAQIAHEWLEIARVIYSKKSDKESKLREAASLSLLAELKTENDLLEEARTDYSTALKIYQEHLEPNDRKIATAYYQLGSVELFLDNPEQSENSFSKSLEVLEANIADKQALIAEDSEGKSIGHLLPEVQDLQALVPEIKEKIAEAKTSAAEMKNMKEALKSAFGFGGQKSSFDASKTAGSGPVNTIQVKRKSKNKDSNPEKKQKK